MKLLITEQEMRKDIKNTLHRVGLRAGTEEAMVEEIKLLPFKEAKQLKAKTEQAIFNLAYPTGHAAYEGDHKTGQMLNGQRYLLNAILMLLEERL